MTNLKIELDRQGNTQKWLAEKAGVTTAAICRYVSGDRIPKAPLACKMAQLLGVEVSDLYPADDEPYGGIEPYVAEPITEKPLIQNIDNPTLIAWFRCGSCYSCLWRKVVLDNDPEHDTDWCSATHNRVNIIDMVKYLGYSKE